MYFSIVLNLCFALSSSSKVYSHLPSNRHCGSRPISCHATWSWNPPRTRTMRGVTTHFSAPKSSTIWVTALKNEPDTRGLAPSLLSILLILLHTSHALAGFRITSNQPSSAFNITLPRYLKEVTISRGGGA